jgi:hypothetical protein
MLFGEVDQQGLTFQVRFSSASQAKRLQGDPGADITMPSSRSLWPFPAASIAASWPSSSGPLGLHPLVVISRLFSLVMMWVV